MPLNVPHVVDGHLSCRDIQTSDIYVVFGKLSFVLRINIFYIILYSLIRGPPLHQQVSDV